MSLWKKLTGHSWKGSEQKILTAAGLAAAAYFGGSALAGGAGAGASTAGAVTGTGSSTLTSLAPIIGGTLGAAGQIYSTNKSIKASQEEIARQNAYNSPASQMQRLQEAGLNPLLVYSSGNVVGNQSGVASSDYSGYGRGISEALSNYMAIDNHDMEMQMKAEQLLNQQINNKWLEVNNALQVMKTATEDRILQADLLTKQYQNNILSHDLDIINKTPGKLTSELNRGKGFNINALGLGGFGFHW